MADAYIPGEIKRFYDDNPLLYRQACREDLLQLSGIYELYPDSVRLLTDREAVEMTSFECQRCGRCCEIVRYVTVSHDDVKRWVLQQRPDILDSLAIDHRRTPLMASRQKEAVAASKAEARSLMERAGMEHERAYELLYVTGLVECSVYVNRKNSSCTFLTEQDGIASCAIHDTRPRVCEKFPFYIGRYTDSRLLKEDSFCPSLRDISKKMKKE